MKVLITGASGFIGSALAAALAARGHEVLRVGRGEGADVRADFAAVPSRDWWARQLAGVDAVVNAVGILREQQGQSFQALHTDAPAELFHGCAMAGVRCVVQVSALGADAQAVSAYHRSKRAADDVLRGLGIPGAVVQPSLVYGAGGSSAALFDTLATAPLLMFPRGGEIPVQPVHVRDVVDGIVALVEQPPASTPTLAFAGPCALSIREYLAELRTLLGLRSRLLMLPLPEGLFVTAARLAGHIPGSMLDGETAGMLLRGNVAARNDLAHLLGRPLTPPGRFLSPSELPAARTQAALAMWHPALKVAVSAVWIWTGIVSLGLYPVEQSLALLARVGLQGAAATAALDGAAALDILLGVLVWVAPLRWRPAVWWSQAALIAGYTVLITIFLPEYWLHPYGPLSKNLPMLAAIGLLAALERR